MRYRLGAMINCTVLLRIGMAAGEVFRRMHISLPSLADGFATLSRGCRSLVASYLPETTKAATATSFASVQVF